MDGTSSLGSGGVSQGDGLSATPPGQVTLKAVAERAGVSTATASRVLSRARATREDTRVRVESAASELGYFGNAIAAALRRSSTETVGMIVPHISNPFFPALVEAVERHLQKLRVDLFLCDSQEDVVLERHRLRALVARQVDGVIIVPSSHRGSAKAIVEAATSVPVVLLDRDVERTVVDGAAGRVGSIPCIRGDDSLGIELVLDHLAALGVREVQFVSAGRTTGTGRRRHDSFVEGVKRRSLLSKVSLLGEFTTDWGRRAARKILGDRDNLPEALVCGNDLIAIGMIQEFHSAGVSVPEQVLVVGYDDTWIAAPSDLTTVRQPREQIAEAAVQALQSPDRENGNDLVFAPELVVRASSMRAEPADLLNAKSET